jgi:hypothetical protein
MCSWSSSLLGCAEQRKRRLRIGQHAENYRENHRLWRSDITLIAAFAILTMLPLTLTGRIRQGLAYGISLGLGFAAAAAPWSYRLEQRFGNPLFPLMNRIFHSPRPSRGRYFASLPTLQ